MKRPIFKMANFALSLVLLISILPISFLLTPAVTVQASDLDTAALDRAIDQGARYILRTVSDPQVDSVGGEWAVIGLARSGFTVPANYFANYHRTVQRILRENDGSLHPVRMTEYARVVLALAATGQDPANVNGHNLVAPLGDTDRVKRQGINGAIWALIALDSNDFLINSGSDARNAYIEKIVNWQGNDGGWTLRGEAGEAGDPDITGMALTALAPYRDRQDVRAAVNRGIAFLSRVQEPNGGFSGGWSDSNLESAVQVAVALTTLGIPIEDSRFVKNGNTLLDNILSFQNSDGSFKHGSNRDGRDQMSSEQGLYGLVAIRRALNGQSSLFDMR